MADSTQVLVHFYRAAIMHADVWRQRLDATTNWAVVTTAAVITFAFGEAAAPHYVLLMAIVFALFFLLMESRRYQNYHIWQQRCRDLHRYLIVPALTDGEIPGEEERREGFLGMATDLSSSVPRLGILRAVGFRMQRNYGPLITIILLAWLLKLWLYPEIATSWAEFIGRAAIGFITGPQLLVMVALFFMACVALALHAPSERIEEWTELSPALARVMPSRSRPAKAAREISQELKESREPSSPSSSSSSSSSSASR